MRKEERKGEIMMQFFECLSGKNAQEYNFIFFHCIIYSEQCNLYRSSSWTLDV